MAATRIRVRIDEALRDRLPALARSNGKSESQVVREALEAYLDARTGKPSAYDVARRAGVIGAARNAPPDLSTNKAHFEDFGRA